MKDANSLKNIKPILGSNYDYEHTLSAPFWT